MYSYEEFKAEFEKCLQELSEGTVYIGTVVKNNNTEVDVILSKESQKNISPCLKVRDFYSKDVDDTEIIKSARWVLDSLESIDGPMHYEKICDWEFCKDKIAFYVINHEWNENMLETLPHRDFLDLAVAFRIYLDEYASATVTQELMDIWKVDVDTLWESAEKNLQKEEFIITSIVEMIGTLVCQYPELPQEVEEKVLLTFSGLGGENPRAKEPDEMMYIMINKRRSLGARCILRKELLKDFADKMEANLFLLPSSLHEFLIVPASPKLIALELQKMVKEVNRKEVEVQERLSDNVYHYDREKDTISVAHAFSC